MTGPVLNFFFPARRVTPPAPLQTKVTVVGKSEIYNRENLVGPFLVHTFFSPRPPPPLPPSPPFDHSPAHDLWGGFWAVFETGLNPSAGQLVTPHIGFESGTASGAPESLHQPQSLGGSGGQRSRALGPHGIRAGGIGGSGRHVRPHTPSHACRTIA